MNNLRKVLDKALIEVAEVNEWLNLSRLITSSQVSEFTLNTQLKKWRIELKFFWKSVELSWEVELKNSDQI